MPLLLLATPIGNLGDVPPRLREALAAAEIIACEDTRRLARLLAHLGISRQGKEVVVYADYNEKEVAAKLIRRLKAGATVALVTDAGTPLLADPGYVLLKMAIDAGVPVDFIPGPSAVNAALALAGLPPYPYAFLGYLPRRPAERRAFLARYASLPATLVLFVTPHRLAGELADIKAAWGDRAAALARELTKAFQEVFRGTLGEIQKVTAARRLKGELTLVVAAPSDAAAGAEDAALTLARALAAAGIQPAKAAAAVAKALGVPKKTLYKKL